MQQPGQPVPYHGDFVADAGEGLPFEPERTRPPWPAALQVGFRFVFVWVLLMEFPFPLGSLPTRWLPDEMAARVNELLQSYVVQPWNDGADKAVEWTAQVLGMEPVTRQVTGSGDSTWSHLHLLAAVVIAATITLIWSLLAGLRRNHHALHEAWRVYVRFALGSALITYGCYKVIPAQMPAPGLDRLVQPIGEASPMGLLWTFLGASQPYQILSGAAELTAGWLLVWRRTTLLGALFAAGVMFNVCALNYCYDVPVKLYSTRLFIMAALLAAADLPRLVRFFVLQRDVKAPPRIGPTPWYGLNVAGLLLGIAFFGHQTDQTLRVSRAQYDSLATPASAEFRGVWDVELFEQDGLIAEVGEPELWQRVIIGNPMRLSLVRAGHPFERLFSAWSDTGNTLTLTRRGEPDWKAEFTYEQPEDGVLHLDGTMDGSELHVELRRIDEPEFLLTGRGFRWINEVPYNR